MLNAPKQSLKPSIFGCQLRGTVPSTNSDMFSFGWGGTVDAAFSGADSFQKYSDFTQYEYEVSPTTKMINVYIVGDEKPGVCGIVEDLFPDYCDTAICEVSSICCSPYGVCCVPILGCTEDIREYDCVVELGGVFKPDAQICDVTVCQTEIFHCCDENPNKCQPCETCSEVAEGTICSDGKAARSGSCDGGSSCVTDCPAKQNCCQYENGEYVDCTLECPDLCDSPPEGNNCANCTDCDEGDKFVCCYDKDGDGVWECGSAHDDEGPRCLECEDGGVKAADCDSCNQLDTYVCDTTTYTCVASAGGKSLNECQASCVDPNPGECCCIGNCCLNGSCNDLGQLGTTISCNDCDSQCGGFCLTGLAGPVSPLGIYAPSSLAVAAVIAGKNNYTNSGFLDVVTTTLNFGLDLPPCNVCDVQGFGDIVGEQGLTCEARPGSRLLVRYDLTETCINDSVKIRIRDFTYWVEILILVQPKNQSSYITIFSDKVALSTVGEIILGEYDCENCEFDYECDYSDGASAPVIFSPKLDTIPGTNLPKDSLDKILPNTDRFVRRQVISAPVELNIHIDEFTPIADFTATQLANFAATNEYTNLARTAGILPYVANTQFTEPYGITCSCEGCESGYASNPAFILVAGGPNIFTPAEL